MTLPMSAPHDDGDDDREWAISLSDLEGDDEPVLEPIEPGSPTLENAVFVVFGVLLTLYVLFGGF